MCLNITDMKRRAIVDALTATTGNMRAAAKRLGIGRTTLYRKIRELDIQPREWGCSGSIEPCGIPADF